jgi:Na+-translocating ferredoxin:NAD+ oxidoreductase RnfA subunit
MVLIIEIFMKNILYFQYDTVCPFLNESLEEVQSHATSHFHT